MIVFHKSLSFSQLQVLWGKKLSVKVFFFLPSQSPLTSPPSSTAASNTFRLPPAAMGAFSCFLVLALLDKHTAFPSHKGSILLHHVLYMDTKRNLYDNFWHMVVGVSGWGCLSVCVWQGPDKVLPCSEACLKFGALCLMLDRSNAAWQEEWMSDNLCWKVPLSVSSNRRSEAPPGLSVLHEGRLLCSTQRCGHKALLACGNTEQPEIKQGLIAEPNRRRWLPLFDVSRVEPGQQLSFILDFGM